MTPDDALKPGTILTGNEGIDIGVWSPPGEPEKAPLPGHEHLTEHTGEKR